MSEGGSICNAILSTEKRTLKQNIMSNNVLIGIFALTLSNENRKHITHGVTFLQHTRLVVVF
jgi:hypothetical protein